MKDFIAEADQLESSGHPDEALTRWREVAAVNPEPYVMARLGRACLNVGLIEEGERRLQDLVRVAPDDPDAYYFLGFHYKNRGRLEEARALLEKGVALREWGPAYTMLGEVCRRLELADAARKSFERAVTLDPDDSEAWYGLGVLVGFKDPDKAIEMFQRALAAYPAESAAHRELGHMLWRKGMLESAEKSVRRALELDPKDPWAHDYLGHLLMIRDAIGEAEQEFRQAIALGKSRSSIAI